MSLYSSSNESSMESLHSLLGDIEQQHSQLLKKFHHLTFRIDDAATDEDLCEFEDHHNQLLKKIHFLSFCFHEEDAEMKRLREENSTLRDVVANHASENATRFPSSPDTLDGFNMGDPSPSILQQDNIGNQELKHTLRSLEPIIKAMAAIRKRHYLLSELELESAVPDDEQQSIIAEGNKVAHQGDGLLDEALFFHGVMDPDRWSDMFARQYGSEVGSFTDAHPLLQRTLNCEATITTVIPLKRIFQTLDGKSKDERSLAKDSIKLIKEAIQRQESGNFLGSVWCIEEMVRNLEDITSNILAIDHCETEKSVLDKISIITWQGTASYPFKAHVEEDRLDNSGTKHTASFQSIGIQQQYAKFSSDELRVIDYTHGRRFGNQDTTDSTSGL